MPSLSLLLGIGAATLSSVASATKYIAQDTYAGSSFFESFNFVTEEKTNGFVKYVDRSRAESQGYISYKDGDAIFGVDYKSKLDSSTGKDIGRESVRLEGKKEYNKGLFVLDIKHMPGGICGTWPAFWSLGREPWPVKGEIDIIEGVNKNSVNKFVLHTDTKCKTDGKGQTGTQALYDCALDGPSGASGCDVNDINTKTYGAGFNANEGGYYVTEWQADGIKMWFFPRSGAPKSLQTSEPDTSEFGIPNANFKGDCDIEKRFMDQRFIFTNTFCGDWAGNVYANSGCPMYSGLNGMDSCKKYVAENPEVFKDAYWRISSFKTYNKRTISSSSSVAPSSTPHTSSSSSVPVSSSSVHASSSFLSVQPSSTAHTSSSSAIHVSSSSVYVSSSSVHDSGSSSAHTSSSSVAHSSSVQSSSVVQSSSTTLTPHVSSSVNEPSSTPAASSSYPYDVSSSVTRGSSSIYSPSASETSYDHVSSSSVTLGSSSIYSPSGSETPYDYTSSSVYSPSTSETSYSHGISSSVYSASVSATPYPHDSLSVYSSASSSYSVSADVSSIYSSETPYGSSSIVYSSEIPYDSSIIYPSSTSSSDAYPDVTSHPVDVKSSSNIPVYSTSAPVYTAYPESGGYEYGDASSKILDTSSKASDHLVASSKTSDYNGNPMVSSSASVNGKDYSSYPVSSLVPEYNDYPAPTPSVKSTPAYADYPELPVFTPLYPTYSVVSSKPSYGDDKKSSDSYKTTTTYQTTYVDICPTGYTTITAEVTAIQTLAPYPTTNAYYAPPGFEVTTKYCAHGCGDGPKTVTVTVPCSKCQASTLVPNKSTDKASSIPSKPTEIPNKPSTPDDSTVKITATKIVTLTKIPVPENQYHATHSSIASASASLIKYPDFNSSKSHVNGKPFASTVSNGNDKPVYPTGSISASKPASPTGSAGSDKPIYSTAVRYPGSNVTISFGTATSAKGKPTHTGYKIPEFTGAASELQVGGIVAGAVAVFAALMI